MVTATYLAAICMAIACFTGVGLTSSLLFPKIAFPIHFCFAPTLLITFLFFLENFIPLGQIPFLWLPWLAWVGFIMLRFPALKSHLLTPVIAYFCAGFFYCLFWRFSFPDICCLGEQLWDLGHLVSWSQGSRLPPIDRLAPGELDTSFPVLQYYAAGLIHRFIGAQPGLTYHLGYCFLTGVAVASFGEGIRVGAASKFAGALGVAWLLLGGNGSSVLVPFIVKDHQGVPAHASDLGASIAKLSDENSLSTVGQWISHGIGTPSAQTPMDYYAYAFQKGDLDPALSGMAFLGLAILAIGLAHRATPNSETDRACVMLAISTPILLLISNTEVAPFQLILIGAWLFYRWSIRRGDSRAILAIPALASFGLIAPWVLHLGQHSTQPLSFQNWVWQPSVFWTWFIALSPAILIWVFMLVSYVTGRSHFKLFACVMSTTVLVGSLLCYGEVNASPISFYTWPWVYALVVAMALVSSSSRVARRVFLGILGITIITNGYLMAVDWYRPLFVSWTPDTGGQKSHVGQLNGWGWLMDDPYNSSVFQVLSSWPEGTVLESSYLNPADSRAGLGLFTGHFQALAWSQHESILRGNRPDLDRLKDLRDDFYMGHASDISWLNSCVPGGVTYIIWDSRDNDRTLVAWPVINEQLKGKYDWKECQKYSMAEWGFWVRRPVAGEQP